MTTIAQAKFQAIPQVQSRISLQMGLAVLLLGLTFAVRITNLNYNTLFVDEAIYATIGQEILAGEDLQAASTWMFGSYFYPAAAAISSNTAGIIGLRALSAILSTTAAVFVFLTTRRLFGMQPALWALLLFGLSGASISVGQFATYDVMGLPFLAIALYGIVSAALTRHQTAFLIGAGLAFTLSFLGKYIALLYLPTLVYLGFVMFIAQRKPIRPLATRFLAVIGLILGAYVLYFLADLGEVFSGKHSTDVVDRLIILRAILEENGPAILAASIGAFFIPRRLLGNFPGWRGRALTVVAVLGVVMAALALPAYHLVSSNVRALEKHVVYALIFLAPLAGNGIAALVARFQHSERQRVFSAILTIAALVWFTNFSLDRNWSFQNGWPNFNSSIEYLREKGLSPDDLVLASGSAIYEYAFGFDIWSSRRVWYNTWYMKYKDIEGVDAMILAIQEHAVDFVVLDDYYTPEMNPVLEPVLEAAGYRQDFQHLEELGNGDLIRIRVFLPPVESVQQ
ncbi:MAG: glycosyltransferase family 39 protein [Chloroflexi bacterium]|nr:glycosyltransferase family 39 protein [Chloroflexota bacterium]